MHCKNVAVEKEKNVRAGITGLGTRQTSENHSKNGI
jgi:hypothetical protein